jgi:hypothetical protein
VKIRLTVEPAGKRLRATIRERDEGAEDRLATFSVQSVGEAKKRASSVARAHGLTTYGFVDKTQAKA